MNQLQPELLVPWKRGQHGVTSALCTAGKIGEELGHPSGIFHRRSVALAFDYSVLLLNVFQVVLVVWCGAKQAAHPM